MTSTFCLREVRLRLEEQESVLPDKVTAQLGLKAGQLLCWNIVRKGIDARRKPAILRVYTVEFDVDEQTARSLRQQDNPRLTEVIPAAPLPRAISRSRECRALVVGMGPAGLFAALRLSDAGVHVTLIERGKPVEERLQDVRRFWAGDGLSAQSNVQFGEGGAGTFSDGKLTSRQNHPATRQVLETLVRFGAPAEILYQAKPHIGSDRLRSVLIRFRQELQRRGCDLRFSTRLTGLVCRDRQVVAAVVDKSGEISCDALVLAPGHSARDTYRLLLDSGILLQTKPFAVGLRVEHPATLINRIQYGLESHSQLPAADYALTWNDKETGRGVYSFCMCPGGVVVNASSEEDGVVVNGMSDFGRAGEYSNSALVVSVRPDDFDQKDALAGVRFQQQWERSAFVAAGGRHLAPAQPLCEFLAGRAGQLRSSCRPGVVHTDLDLVLPDFVRQGLRRALPQFDRKMRGFVSEQATLVGIETRTSAPLRILRDERCQSISHAGLFPAGEGAGYAGGIMSAAIDGLRVADNIIEQNMD
ncbi:MAG: hypothetical protein C0618_05035 [Desulfuromonas sp.]|nr:MAG: hypothetical protein C0618_05035 [Desulfuromonas sp.]